MTLIDSVQPDLKAKALLPLLTIILLILAVVYLALTPPKPVECIVPSDLKVSYAASADDKRLDGAFWACNGPVCDRYMAPEEWAKKFCAKKDGAILCVVRTQQGPVTYPLQMLNLSAIKECAQYHCMQEVLVRNASYALSTI